jgi:hypothetical protein
MLLRPRPGVITRGAMMSGDDDHAKDWTRPVARPILARMPGSGSAT